MNEKAHDMSHGRLDLILEEVEKRQIVEQAVDAILKAHFKKLNKARVQKHVVHELVAEKLGVILNSKIRALVNERMHALGFPSCILHGGRFFRHVTRAGWLDQNN